MYIELLPEYFHKFESIIQNSQNQLFEYVKKDNANKNFIAVKENEIFQLKQILTVFNNCIIEYQQQIVEAQDKAYLKGMQVNDQSQLERSFKNNYHAGSVIKEFLTQLQKLHEKRETATAGN